MQDQDERIGPASAGEPDDESVSTEEGRRPTPVRMVMEGGAEEAESRQEEKRVVHDEGSGLDWVVTVSGRSASGILPLRTVLLMELNFAKAEEPDRPLRRALCHGGDLADISDDQLLSSFRSSEPFREPIREPNGDNRRGRMGKALRGTRD